MVVVVVDVVLSAAISVAFCLCWLNSSSALLRRNCKFSCQWLFNTSTSLLDIYVKKDFARINEINRGVIEYVFKKKEDAV